MIYKKEVKTAFVTLIGAVLLSSAILSMSLSQNVFSQSNASNATGGAADQMKSNNNITSILENSTEGMDIVSKSPEEDVTPGQPIQVIPNSFIVQLKPAEVGTFEDQVSTLSSELESAGGNVTAVYDQLGMLSIQFGEPQAAGMDTTSGNVTGNVTLLPEAQEFIAELQANPNVEAVYNDGIVTIQAQTLTNDQNRVDADLSASKSGDGTGDVNADIAVIDTGAQQDHPDLNVFDCVSFVGNPTANVPLNTCADGHGHGTHVSGTAAAKDDNVGVVGKAPGARVWAIKVLDDSGSGTFSDILEGANYVASHADAIDVVNLSLGGVGTFAPLETALTNLVNTKGVVVVVAAGNNHDDANNFTPARTPAAITVSAMADTNGKCGGGGPDYTYPSGPPDKDDSFARFSNYGIIVDLSAPGVGVYSTEPGSSYGTKSGTSMAAPNVAGAAALYRSLHPAATPADVDTYLKNFGTKAPTSGDPLVPCDGNGKGYFEPTQDVDTTREPLLYMAAESACPSGPLTGHWKNDDGGRYYIKQCGKTVWWAGLSGDGDGTQFSNVFKGKLTRPFPSESSNQSSAMNQTSAVKTVLRGIVGDWCDVPRGTIMNCGLLTLKIVDDNTLRKVSSTGGFSGSEWTRIP